MCSPSGTCLHLPEKEHCQAMTSCTCNASASTAGLVHCQGQHSPRSSVAVSAWQAVCVGMACDATPSQGCLSCVHHHNKQGCGQALHLMASGLCWMHMHVMLGLQRCVELQHDAELQPTAIACLAALQPFWWCWWAWQVACAFAGRCACRGCGGWLGGVSLQGCTGWKSVVRTVHSASPPPPLCPAVPLCCH